MTITAEKIEKTFFNFIIENGKAPSRKEIVSYFDMPGPALLEILGEFSKNLETTWRLNEMEREMLGKLIIDADKSLHTILSKVSFLPVWSSQCRVISRKMGPKN